MQTKSEYLVSETGKNMVYVIERITDMDGRLLIYKIIKQLKKYSHTEKFHNEHSIQAYVRSLNN